MRGRGGGEGGKGEPMDAQRTVSSGSILNLRFLPDSVLMKI